MLVIQKDEARRTGLLGIRWREDLAQFAFQKLAIRISGQRTLKQPDVAWNLVLCHQRPSK